MKGNILLAILFSVLSFSGFSNNADTTVTSFEIKLKRKADNALGFNTCTIDRMRLYELVINRLQAEFDSRNFKSLHNPMVLMKFVDVAGNEQDRRKTISESDRQSLKQYQYSHFIKIYGHLDIDGQLNHQNKATFTLKVYVFDRDGKLVNRCKSKSRDKGIVSYISNQEATDEISTLNEQQFFDLVSKAADSLELSI